MFYKPFRPPFLRDAAEEGQHSPRDDGQPPAAKKRRVGDQQQVDSERSDENAIDWPLDSSPSSPAPQLSFARNRTQIRKSLLSIGTPAVFKPISDSNIDNPHGYYNVLWRKFTMKKHKTWDGDGILAVRDGYAYLQDDTGREMGRVPCKGPLLSGSTLSIGGKDVEIDSVMSKTDFMAGKLFLGAAGKPTVRELDEKLRTNIKFNSKARQNEDEKSREPISVAAVSSKATHSHFKNPLLNKDILPRSNCEKPLPRHDPDQPGALVMTRPKAVPNGKQIVDVVVDPVISNSLRDHQREGVKFMYECIMGMRPDSGVGAILADEMGLGKTLQVIALLWTLLKQNPIHNQPPIIKKALVVCPVTLIKNWRKEFRKWLGNERIGVFVVDDNKARLTDFTMGKSYSVMIIGYEKLRIVQADLRKGAGIDIVIADEGHRLKTAKNKSAEAIKSLDIEKRVILSGTPLQNDLSEFYFMVDFVNPGLLGKANTFKKEFDTPILKSRQPGANSRDVGKGQGRSQELARLTGAFILRRTAEVLARYLPPKAEYVLFCRPTSAQASVYRNVLASPVFGAVLDSPAASLQLIHVLKKLCNSPSLLRARDEIEEDGDSTIASLLSGIPQSLLKSPGASGKLQVLDSLLHRVRTVTEEKVVIVSHYTSTLNLIENFLCSLSYSWLRLDGSTPSSKRQGLVEKFNRTDATTCFVFLLSAKAGGMGINLVGASRLILYDIDWNPSIELQAMARIHRDGQKRPCKIYRLLTQGALDEKIYQRQLTKMSLADSVVDNKVSTSAFTREELRDLFSLDGSGNCQTHELLGCGCGGRAVMAADRSSSIEDKQIVDGDATDDEEVLNWRPELIKASQLDVDAQEQRIKEQEKQGILKMSALMQYQHINTAKMAASNQELSEISEEEAEVAIDDDILLDVLKDEENGVSFLFAKTSF